MDITPSDEPVAADSIPLTDPEQLPDTDPDALTCVVCGVPLTYGGRGPKPKYCDDHKKNKPKGTRRSSKNVDVLIGQISDIYLTLGSGLSAWPPTSMDGMVVASSHEKLAESWRPLIEKDPKIRKFWEKMTTGSGWSTVMITHVPIAFAILQVHGIQIPGFPDDNEDTP